MYTDFLKEFEVSTMEELSTSDKFIKYLEHVELFNDSKVERYFFMDGHLYLCFETSVVRVGLTQIGLTIKAESMLYITEKQED